MWWREAKPHGNRIALGPLLICLSLALVFLPFSLIHSGWTQVILTEVMVDPDTLEFYNEFVELYNTGTEGVDLAGWRIGDGEELDAIVGAGEGTLLQSGQWAVVLDPGYFGNSTIYDSLIPPQALILTIEDAAFGQGGWSNSRSEPVILTNPKGDTVQFFLYPTGTPPGHSLEKINLTANNDLSNWAVSRQFRGTPGGPNSVTPLENDLAVRRFRLLQQPVLEGQSVDFEATVLNRGQQARAATWVAFYDQNNNRVPEPAERVRQDSLPPLAPSDSLTIQASFPNIPAGTVRFGFAVLLPADQDTSNNVQVVTQVVSPAGLQVVINEILFEPASGQGEWVEIYNPGSVPADLSTLYFADAKDTVHLSAGPRVLEPGAFAVLGGDSALEQQYSLPVGTLVVVRNFPTLNNNFDDLKLLTTGGLELDRVPYTRRWYGREDVAKGTSLEKLNPGFNGRLSQSWSASVDPSGSTPGRQNSVFLTVLPARGQLDISPNPFSPDGDGREDFTVVRFELPVETAFVSLRIFDIRGRLVRTLAEGLPAASHGQLIWDGKTNTGRTGRIGMYLLVLEALNPAKKRLLQLKGTVALVKRR
ncbi:MAG: hypothetical protein D6715_01330 [Calditrichaeota bacterium]|nr:MAG: hypothetical protein D6715_01330 [Calditrichota bacterium]